MVDCAPHFSVVADGTSSDDHRLEGFHLFPSDEEIGKPKSLNEQEKDRLPDGEHCSGYGANSGWHISIPIGWADTSKHTITVQEQRYLRGEDEKTGTALPDADAPIKWYVTVQYSDGCWEAQPYRLATL